MTELSPPAPRFHFSPSEGLFGDPKPFVWNGEYHVFFQNSPRPFHAGAELEAFAAMRWAHVVSEDLVHWRRLDDALVPTPGSPDAHGCWTGSVIQAQGRFHIFYTGVAGSGGRRQSICHATSDDLIAWRKDPRNPLVTAQAPFATAAGSAWRDPQVVPAPGGGWEMLLTADLPGAPEALRGCIARLASDDLVAWRVVGLEHHPKSVHRCECPDTFALGDLHVLLYSDFGVQLRTSSGPRGPWRRPDVALLDDFRYYAAKTTAAAPDRRIMFGFLFGRAAEEGAITDSSPWTWGGTMALPRDLRAGDDGTVRVAPAPELESLRCERLRVPTVSPLEIGSWSIRRRGAGTRDEKETGTEAETDAGTDAGTHAREDEDGDASLQVAVHGRRSAEEDELGLRLMGRHPLQFELACELTLDAEDAAGVLLGSDPGLSRGYRIDVDRRTRQISLSRLLPHQNPASRQLQHLALPPRLPSTLPLRLILDASVLEVFVADRVCFSARLYDLADATHWWGFVCASGTFRARDVRAWRLEP